ncbi:MAG: hypothetical protein H0X40_03500 [Chthoniobacterales bacterium]|nr:hypothetical protein [Chthoniobacterales bacterium]
MTPSRCQRPSQSESSGITSCWRNKNFSFRDISYGYTDDGTFNGSGIVTATVQLTSSTTFTYTSTIDFYDADGNLLFSICGMATATRFQ